MSMSWILLFFAGLFEIGWAVGLRFSDGWSRLFPSLFTIGAMAISFWLLSLALRGLPLGTAYAVWTGIGAVGTAVVGMLWLGEGVSLLRLGSIALIVIGLVGLKAAAH
jgi:quaternary ammonium compound-resistance protein SugE